MRFVSRTGMIATTLAIGAIAAPNAQAGLFSTGPDPKGAVQQEAQSFLRIYSHPASTPPDRAAVARDKASIGAAFDRIALAFDRDSTSTATPVAGIAQGSPGFRYGDAAIGAGMMAGLILLGTAGAIAVRRRTPARHP